MTNFTLPAVEVLSVSQDDFGRAHVKCRLLGVELPDVTLDVDTLKKPPEEVQAILESAVTTILAQAIRNDG